VISSFVEKIGLWQQRLSEDNFDNFVTLSKYDLCAKLTIKNVILEHLVILQNEFRRYFPEMQVSETRFIRQPFNCTLNEIPAELQEEWIDLKNDYGAQDLFIGDLNNFWVSMMKSYPRLSKAALIKLIPFASTYLSETAFSALISIKSKSRNRLEVEADIRCALSQTLPNFDLLASEKRLQYSSK